MLTPHVEFFPDKGSAIVEIPRPPLVDVLKPHALEDDFDEKDEFHVTILSPTRLSPKEKTVIRSVIHNEPVRDIEVSEDVVYRINSPKTIRGETYARESIIARVYSDDIMRYLTRVAMLTHLDPNPYLHVTLFTKGRNALARRGIGIRDEAELWGMRPRLYPPRP